VYVQDKANGTNYVRLPTNADGDFVCGDVGSTYHFVYSGYFTFSEYVRFSDPVQSKSVASVTTAPLSTPVKTTVVTTMRTLTSTLKPAASTVQPNSDVINTVTQQLKLQNNQNNLKFQMEIFLTYIICS